MGLHSLTLMHQPAVAYLSSNALGLFNHITWPNIAFLFLGVIIFVVGAYARMPHFMEMDKKTRKRYETKEKITGDKMEVKNNEH